ncbi:hypothetical protein CDAR_529081 [Caerostris darwini]|uniref:Uncharacterized protein n=1 Tax=Caerostris darwini TaxID=1538125 RepID=A0AAV4UD64_9ARAC|nr:hypothetical protein CDAR_529081 [Caerostris darwini]
MQPIARYEVACDGESHLQAGLKKPLIQRRQSGGRKRESRKRDASCADPSSPSVHCSAAPSQNMGRKRSFLLSCKQTDSGKIARTAVLFSELSLQVSVSMRRESDSLSSLEKPTSKLNTQKT